MCVNLVIYKDKFTCLSLVARYKSGHYRQRLDDAVAQKPNFQSCKSGASVAGRVSHFVIVPYGFYSNGIQAARKNIERLCKVSDTKSFARMGHIYDVMIMQSNR